MQPISPETNGLAFRARAIATALLCLSMVAFLFTDSWFSILEDETTIVAFANQSPATTFEQFWSGQGQHKHPPLSDLFLHAWMRVGGEAQWTLRLPSVALYLAGLVALAFSAKKISGVAAFLPVISIGVLWPFGFHFGRLVGWYSWSFFLVAILTLAYLRVLEKPSWPRLYAFVVCALLLVYSNYFGWAVIGCIALDIALFRRHPFAARLLLVTIATLGLAYLPLWPILFEIVMTSSTVGMRDISWVSTTLHGLFSLYALFLSESIAPWHWVRRPPGFE